MENNFTNEIPLPFLSYIYKTADLAPKNVQVFWLMFDFYMPTSPFFIFALGVSLTDDYMVLLKLWYFSSK
jgi:hypothetical protein